MRGTKPLAAFSLCFAFPRRTNTKLHKLRALQIHLLKIERGKFHNRKEEKKTPFTRSFINVAAPEQSGANCFSLRSICGQMMHRRMPRDFAERTKGASIYDVRFWWSHKRRLSEGGSIIVTALISSECGQGRGE